MRYPDTIPFYKAYRYWKNKPMHPIGGTSWPPSPTCTPIGRNARRERGRRFWAPRGGGNFQKCRYPGEYPGRRLRLHNLQIYHHCQAGCLHSGQRSRVLVAQSHLTVRAGNLCRWLPRNLSEVYHLRCSREFPTPESFSRVSRMLSICLAAARPLSPRDLAGILRERDGGATECGAALVGNLRKMAGMLQVEEGRVVFAHSSVRDWLQDDRHRYLNNRSRKR